MKNKLFTKYDVLLLIAALIMAAGCAGKIHPADQAAPIIVLVNESYLAAVDTGISLREACTGGAGDSVNPMCNQTNWNAFKATRQKIMPRMAQLRAAWLTLAKTEAAIADFQQSELYKEVEELIEDLRELSQ